MSKSPREIRRIIVEDIAGITVVSHPLKSACSENELRKAFADQKLYILNVNTDSVGVALVRVCKKLNVT